MQLSPPALVALACALAPAAQGQCLDWSPGYGPWGTNGGVTALATWSDGQGPALYAGGFFTVAGDAVAAGVVRWDGGGWSPLGSGLPGAINSLASFDDGSGSALYVGGWFTSLGSGAPARSIARWDGASWSEVGGGMAGYSVNHVSAMAVFDEGAGPVLFAGGSFITAGGVPAGNLARWDGASWSSVGSNPLGPGVEALLVHDDGSGPALYVAGRFTAPFSGIARWDGTSFSDVGGGVNAGIQRSVYALAEHDTGSGPELHAAGDFTLAGAHAVDKVARWDGTSWSAVGTGHGIDQVLDLASFDDGSGTRLFATGRSFGANTEHLAVWDGASWSPLGAGVDQQGEAFEVFDAGQGPELFLGGSFALSGTERVESLARWTGSAWKALHEGGGTAIGHGAMDAFCVLDLGAGPQVFADHGYGPTGGEGVDVFDGLTWTPLGPPGDGNVHDLQGWDAGAGLELYAAGEFSSLGGAAAEGLARWNGTAWSEVGGGVQGLVRDLALFDLGAGPVLMVAGNLDQAGGAPASNVLAWDGTAWTSLGTTFDGEVRALEVFDEGSGARLFAGGAFVVIDGVLMNRVARWNGVLWTPTFGGTGARVNTLRTFDDGSGPALYAGGAFVVAGGLPTPGVARWDGADWSAVGAGLDGLVRTLAVLDDGAGERLFAGGHFHASGPTPMKFLASWDGSDWSALPDPVDRAVYRLLATEADGLAPGPALHAGGTFDSAGSQPAISVARLGLSCPCPPVSYCTAKVNSQGCTPAAYTTGSTSIASNSLRIRAVDVLNNKSGLLFWGLESKAAPFQGGTKCVSSPVHRTPLQDSGGNPPPDDCSGSYAFHFNKPYITASGLLPGVTLHAQYWSRDPAASFTTGLTDGVRFTLCP